MKVLINQSKHRALIRVGSIIAPFLVMLGLIFLLSELGQPFRIYKLPPSPPGFLCLGLGGLVTGIVPGFFFNLRLAMVEG